MARTPRITMSVSLREQEQLNKVVKHLGLTSPGQLLRMLVSGDVKRVEWICEELKKTQNVYSDSTL